MQAENLEQAHSDYPLSLRHFRALMGPHGLYQHATKAVPLLSEGYCTDDNARAVQILATLRSVAASGEKTRLLDEVDAFESRCWQFLREAQSAPGLYRNFRTAEGEWLPHNHESEDMYARLVRGLVAVLVYEGGHSRAAEAETMFADLVDQRLPRLRAPRAVAEVLVALTHVPVDLWRRYHLIELVKLYLKLLQQLWDRHAVPNWSWFEDIVTYANALLPHGVLASCAYSPSPTLDTILHHSADFLVRSTIIDHVFIPIGSDGWYPKGGTPSRNNQQALEASTMFDFLIDYSAAFPDTLSVETIAAPYLWFFGKNTGHTVMADVALGASLDGLFDHGPNPNYGAESMLAYLWSEIRLRQAPRAVRAFVAPHASVSSVE